MNASTSDLTDRIGPLDPPTPETLCGTVAGQQRHIREGSSVCEDCREAAAQKARETRARNALGMPVYYRGSSRDADTFHHERPPWAARPELADAALMGPFVHDLVRWSA